MDEPTRSEILIDYHFGTLSAEAAAGVEERLLADGDLLRAYLQLKRQLDGTSLARPSPEAGDRLRRAVVAAYGPGPARSLRRWLNRPMPLYQTLAVAAAVAVVVAVMGVVNPRARPAAPGESISAGVFPEAAPVVDSARARPASLEVF